MKCTLPLNIFAITVTASMPVEGFGSFVHDPNDTMPYRGFKRQGKGQTQSMWHVTLLYPCPTPATETEPAGSSCCCPDGGGVNCAGDAAVPRSQRYKANESTTILMDISITEKGNYKKRQRTLINKSSSGSANKMSVAGQTTINELAINNIIDPSSKNFCMPVTQNSRVLCGCDSTTCERQCNDAPYDTGGCAGDISSLPFLLGMNCVYQKETIKCTNNPIPDPSPAICDEDSYQRSAEATSTTTVFSQVTEDDILSKAKQAARIKINLKKENQITSDYIKEHGYDITGEYDCYHVKGFCPNEDSEEGGSEVDSIVSIAPGEETEAFDHCDVTWNPRPTTCNCSPDDKDACWTGFGGVTVPSEFSYTTVTMGIFKIATDFNKEYFSKSFKSISGKVYFYIPSESEPESTPCCTSCEGEECFTGEILSTSPYTINNESSEFKNKTRLVSDELSYKYDSSEVYAIHPGKDIRVCYTVDKIESI